MAWYRAESGLVFRSRYGWDAVLLELPQPTLVKDTKEQLRKAGFYLRSILQCHKITVLWLFIGGLRGYWNWTVENHTNGFFELQTWYYGIQPSLASSLTIRITFNHTPIYMPFSLPFPYSSGCRLDLHEVMVNWTPHLLSFSGFPFEELISIYITE